MLFHINYDFNDFANYISLSILINTCFNKNQTVKPKLLNIARLLVFVNSSF